MKEGKQDTACTNSYKVHMTIKKKKGSKPQRGKTECKEREMEENREKRRERSRK